MEGGHFKKPSAEVMKAVKAELIEIHNEVHPEQELHFGRPRGLKVKQEATVVGPTSYKGRRIKQLCRWASTTTLIALAARGLEKGQIQEIQATVYPPTGNDPRFYIAANTGNAMTAMGELFGQRPVADVLSGLAADAPKVTKNAAIVEDLRLGPRLERHPENLTGLLRGRPQPSQDAGDTADVLQVVNAWKKSAVIAKGPHVEGVHAERRLHETIKAQGHPNLELNPNQVGGTRRPCGICFILLYPDWQSEVYPGSTWLTTNAAAGLADMSPRQIAELVIGLPPPRVTLAEGEKEPTDEYDSESDKSDVPRGDAP